MKKFKENYGETYMNRNKKIAALLILLAISIPVALAAAENVQNIGPNNGIAINPKIPKPTAPSGFTDQQINQAQQIAAKNLVNTTNNLTKTQTQNTGIQPLVATQNGNDKLFAVISPIEDKYIITCNCPLDIPIKTEIWDMNFVPAQQGYGYVDYWLYYWNYYTNSWTPYNRDIGRWTNSNGQANVGFSIPYRLLSDKYYIGGDRFLLVNGVWQYDYYQKFFTVSWY
jgi:hypothetical protein